MHIGFDFTPPDVPGKVTGEIKYAEDYKKRRHGFRPPTD
jgi:hypothetical protein